jgi:hypothetical protein
MRILRIDATAGPWCEMPASSLKPRVDRRKPCTSGSRPLPGNSTTSALVATMSGSPAVAAPVSAARFAPMPCGPPV